MNLLLQGNDFRVEPHASVCIADWPTHPAAVPGLEDAAAGPLKKHARAVVKRCGARLADAQQRLWAANRNSVLVILQGLDASGKDGTIKHVSRGLNPAGIEVTGFQEPCIHERSHHFLRRYAMMAPASGRIGIFNRSYYEDVITARVHPEAAALSPGADPADPAYWLGRLEDINAFERHLSREGTLVVKCFLHVSPEAQRRRLQKRLRRPDKHWKFSLTDLLERRHRDAHLAAIDAALSRTSTGWAPWYVVPADHKWLMRAIVATVLAEHIDSLDPRYPEPGREKRRAMDQALQTLEQEA